MSEFAPFIRIAMRYFAGILVAKGSIDVATADTILDDPDLVSSLIVGIEAVFGLAAAVVSEFWYRAARLSDGAR